MNTNLNFYLGFSNFVSQKKKGSKKELKWMVIEVIFFSPLQLFVHFSNFFNTYLHLSCFIEKFT